MHSLNITPLLLDQVPAQLQNEVQKVLDRLSEILSDELLQQLTHNKIADSFLKVCLSSQFILESWIRYPQLITSLIETNDLFRALSVADYTTRIADHQCESEMELSQHLRLFRRREMIRIGWRDLAGWADTNETLFELSLLAESCIQTALDFCYQKACHRYGTPTLSNGKTFNLVVLGMGKLGAWELNYSSDIDLILAYAEEGTLKDSKETSYSEFFTKITRSMVKLLDETTVDGFVFRTDLRLRPFGDSGPLLMSFEGMEKYYLTQAREWERYAMIKARQVAGDIETGQILSTLIQPFVYRRYLDYGAFDELRTLKIQITNELRRKDRIENVKLGPGGIREIEFIGQAFQLIRGGQEKALQRREIQVILKNLAKLNLLPKEVVSTLLCSYHFLRRVENHIQEFQDKQTHDLPSDPIVRQILAFSLGFDNWEHFKMELDQVRDKVHLIFEDVFSIKEDDLSYKPSVLIWNEDNQALSLLDHLGFQQPEQCYELIKNFKNSPSIRKMTTKGIKILSRLMPLLIDKLALRHDASIVLDRILALFELVAGRNVYLSLLAENPSALNRLIELTASSIWISRYLAAYPLLMDELLDDRSLYAPLQKKDLVQDLKHRLQKTDPEDTEKIMTVFREFKQVNLLRVAAADIMGVIPVMVVSDYLTWIAEAICEQVLHYAWFTLQKKHGIPVNSSITSSGFAIIGFGKLGGIELGYGSDLDLVFLHQSPEENTLTNGEKPISCELFYQKLAQKFRHIMDTRMLSGILYETDLRLRPNGNSGVLVPHIDHYQDYYQKHAWTWEHQAIVRARFVAGDPDMEQKFNVIRHTILALPRDVEQLRQDVKSMRDKMRQHLVTTANSFDIKLSDGGMADIEFLVQFGALSQTDEHPEIAHFTDNIRMIESLEKTGFFNAKEAHILKTVYREYRDYGHHQTLQDNAALTTSDKFVTQRNNIRQIWQKFF